jgi:hypothetical protein
LNHKPVSRRVVHGVLHAVEFDGDSVGPAALDFREHVDDSNNSGLEVDLAHVRVSEKSVCPDFAAKDIRLEVDCVWPLYLNRSR